jgi:hypothetical protein
MFQQNKYTRWYNSIICKAQNQTRNKNEQYYESHHILPKSMGGSNKPENMVFLTAREHYITHLLLMKMPITKRDQYKMASAYQYMSKVRNDYTRGRYNSRLFEYHKAIRSKLMSEQMSGSGNPNYGKKASDEKRKRISEARIGVNTNTVEGREAKRQKFLTNNPNYDPIAKAKTIEKNSKTYRITTPNGEELIIKNLNEWCKQNKVSPGNLCVGPNKEIRRSKGYTCEMIDPVLL